jgi:hypothetical protein
VEAAPDAAAPWQVTLAKALAQAHAGEGVAAAEAVVALSERIAAEPTGRSLETLALRLTILREALVALRRLKADDARARLLAHMSEVAEANRLMPPVRFELCNELLSLTSDDVELEAQLNARKDQAIEDERQHAEFLRTVHSYEIENSVMIEDEKARVAIDALAASNPTHHEAFRTIYIHFEPPSPAAFDALAVAFELNPDAAWNHVNHESQRFVTVDKEIRWMAEAVRGSLLSLLEESKPLASLPYPCDRSLRQGLAMARVQQASVEAPVASLAGGFAETEAVYHRFPGSLAANVLQAFLRLESEDAGGALVWLERAELIQSPFTFVSEGRELRLIPESRDLRPIRLAQARAYARLRQTEEAVRVLKPIATRLEKPTFATAEPWFRANWDDPRTLLESFQKIGETIKRAYVGRIDRRDGR